MTSFVLVPGFWLGAWSWDEVAAPLRAAGHDVDALTLPGLEGTDVGGTATPRAGITLRTHVDAVAEAVRSAGEDVVLVAHSGAGAPAHGVTDLMPERLRRVVYVDSGPLPGGAHADLPADATELPLPAWSDLDASLEGLDETMLATFRSRAVPHPAGPARDALTLTNETARRTVPVTVVCSSYPAAQVQELAAAGMPLFAELAQLDVDYVDLPTGHWPQWSRPADLAAALVAAAGR